jgi:hypothetical protein
MILITQHWNFDSKRKNDILTVMMQNLKCTLITKIYIFLEYGAPKLLNHNKIQYIENTERISYYDMFEFCNKNFTDICIVANADISFNETLLETQHVVFNKTVIALSSYDFYTQTINEWSYDSFIFRPLSIPKSEYRIGEQFSDLKFSKNLIDSGLQLINPSNSIITYHNDSVIKLKDAKQLEMYYFSIPHKAKENTTVINNHKEMSRNIAALPKPKLPQNNQANSIFVNKKIAVILHLYFQDLWEEFYSYLSNLNGYNFQLFISLVKGSCSEGQMSWIKKEIIDKYPNAIILIVENKGLDIGGFLQCFKYIIQNGLNYDYILKIHSKKSLKSSAEAQGAQFGAGWRKRLIDPLLGSPVNINTCLTIINRNDIGIVSQLNNISNFIGHNTNELTILKSMLGVNNGGQFIAGTMFWIKFSTVAHYLNNVIIIDNIYNMLENGYVTDQTSGTYTHSMERIFGYMATDLNQKIVST